MSNEVNDLGDLLLKMIEQGSTTFKQSDVVQELHFPDIEATAKVHFSLAIRITNVELPDSEVVEL